MKDEPLLFVIIMSILIVVALAISSTALYFTQTQSESFSTQEVTDLKLLSSNIFISSGGCLTSKCFTDDIPLESFVDCRSCNPSRSVKNQSLQGFAQMEGGVFSGDSVLLGTTNFTESELSCVSTFQFPTFATKSLSSQDRLTLPNINGTIVYDTDLQQLSILQDDTWLFFGDSTIASVSGTSGQIVNNGTLQNPVLGLVATSVTPGTYTNPSIQVDQFGRTISISDGSSGVTSITGSSSIQVTGTAQIPILNLTDTTVTPGSFTFASLTVDQKGRISTISSNSIVGSSQIDVTGTSTRTITLNASVQASIDAKLPLIGGTVTGSILNTFSTTATTPQFAIGAGTGIYSSAANTFNIATNGVNQFQINSSGVVSISQLSNGVVKCSSQILSSSTIINADITDGAIHNEKLFAASSTSTASSIVLRDSSQHFSARSISVIDNPSNPTDATNKAYVDAVSSLGLVIHPPVRVVDTITNQTLTTLPIIDGVSLNDGDRVLLTVQTNPLENGAWVANIGAWTRPTDFISGQSAATAYFLVQEGTQYQGSSWGCTTPAAIVDTDPLSFSLFSLPQTISGSNEGTGEAIFRNVMSNNLSFKTITQSPHIILTGSSLELNIATDAVSTSTASTIVARDASQNFAAGTISAILDGNINKASGNVTITTAFGLAVSVNGTTNAITLSQLSSLGIVHNSALGLLSTSLIVNADVDPSAAIVDTKLATISTAGKVSNSATTATSANTASAIVARDGSGNFAAGTISGNISGNLNGNINKTSGNFTITTAFGLALTVDATNNAITLSQLSTLGIVHNSALGLLSTSLIVNADIDPSAAIVDTKLATISTTGKVSNSATTATAANTASAIVLRDGSGNFAAGTITGNVTGNLNGNISKTAGNFTITTAFGLALTVDSTNNAITLSQLSTLGIVHNSAAGLLSTSLIVNADVSVSAAIDDTKLATISTTGKVSNSATTATAANTNSAIVARDGSGNFAAGTITATITGHASLDLALTGGTMSGNLNMGTQEITNCFAIRSSNTNIIIGTSATALFTNNVIIGNSASNPDATLGSSVIIGQNTIAHYDQNVVIGQNASCASAGCTIVGQAASAVSSFNCVFGQLAVATASKGVALGYIASCADNSIAIGRNSLSGGNFGITIGTLSTNASFDSIILGHNSVSGAAGADVFGSNVTNSTSNSLLIGNGSYVNIRSNATCDIGTSGAKFQSLYLSGNIVGPTNSRTTDDIVSNSGTGTSGNLASFSSAKIIQDSGIAYDLVVQDNSSSSSGQVAVYTASKNIAGGALISSLETTTHAASTYMPLAGGIFTGDVSFATHNITNLGNVNGKTAANLVTNTAATSNTGNLAQFSSTTGFDVSDSKVVAANVVTNSGTAVSGSVAYFTGNKVVADSGVSYLSIVQDSSVSTSGQVAVYTASKNIAGGALISSLLTVTNAAATYMPLAGGTFTGNVNFGGFTISNASTIAATSTVSATTFNASAPTGLTSFATSGQSISFTGGTGKVIDLATFTTTLNSADWALTSNSTGEAKYTGTATKTHDIVISFSLQPITTACNFQIWITKNTSLTSVDYIGMDFAASSITNYTPFTVTRKLSLVTNDKVQLAGLVTGASPSINFKWVKIMITSCP